MAWPTIIDDDGTGTTGTVLDNAFFNQIKGHVDETAASNIITSNVSGNITEFNPGVSGNPIYVVLSNNAGGTIHSCVGGPGQRIVFINEGTGNFAFTHLSASGPNANFRFINIATSGATYIASGGSLAYFFDPLTFVWRLERHEQGRAIAVAYSAANFYGNVGTLTVEAGDLTKQDYILRGNVLTVTIMITTASTSGSPSLLYLAGWVYPFPVVVNIPALYYNGSAWQNATINTEAGIARAYMAPLGAATFPNLTNTFYLSGQFSIAIT